MFLLSLLQTVPAIPVIETQRTFFSLDFGQLLIAGLIAVVGYLMKSEIADFKRRLNRHDEMLIGLVGDVQNLIGLAGGVRPWNGTNRRNGVTE